ncbi:MAG: exo-alpha-sialidase [Proteobacteria bacterium]|nr:exo-alpha-sialidase [Pseudomonadota bacterium]MCP4917374.1 exo-alpha-sialidase [Pseudomonadota bacterium]
MTLLLLACTPTVPESETADSTDSEVLSPPELAWTLVDEDAAEGADVAVAPDGTLYASFVRGGHVWVRVSEDGGASWSDATWVNDAGNPSVYQVSHPEIDVDADRVLVSMPSGHDQALFVSDRGPLEFSTVAWVGHDQDDWQFEAIFFQGRLAPDGSIWSSFHAFPNGSWSDGWKGIARESNGFELENVSESAAGEPCECCAHDLFFTSSADVALAWRGNVDDIRDMWVATGHGGFDSVVTAGDLAPDISYCPVQGPRLAEQADGTLVMVWADAMQSAYAPYIATSADGESWTPSEKVMELDEVRPSPTIAVDGDDRMLVAWNPEFGPSGLALDRGAGWEHLGALEVEDSEVQFVELVGQGEFLGGVGVDEAGRVWVFRL